MVGEPSSALLPLVNALTAAARQEGAAPLELTLLRALLMARPETEAAALYEREGDEAACRARAGSALPDTLPLDREEVRRVFAGGGPSALAEGALFPVMTGGGATHALLIGPAEGASDAGFVAAAIIGLALSRRDQRQKQFSELSRVMERCPSMVIVTDSQGRIEYVNPRFEQITGYSAAEAAGRNIDFLRHERADGPGLWRMVQSSGEWRGELHNRRKDGSAFWASASVSPVRDDDGQIVRYLSIQEDITERRRLETDQQRLARLVELSTDFIAVASPDYRISYVNPAGLRMTGRTTEDLDRGLTMEDLQVIPEGIAAALEKGYWEGETVFRRKDGTSFPASQVISVILSPGGEVEALTTITRDITAQKQALAEIEAQHLFLRQVIDMSPTLIFARDQAGRMTLANRRMAEMIYNDTAENLIGRAHSEMGGTSEQEMQFLADDREVMASGQNRFIPEEQLTDVHGVTHWMQTTKIPLRDPDGEARQVLSVAVDITEQKVLQRQIEESLERRSRQVETATDVAQEIAAASDLDELFGRVVTLIKERFGYYHAQIFLYDAAAQAMRLVKGYGPVGERMVAAGHQLPLGRGVVGVAGATRQSMLASDAVSDPDWVPNPNLPDTRGELAVPIRLGGDLLGVLDVQSETAGRLTREDQLLLEGLCGQIAIAVNNTRLLEERIRAEQQIKEERSLLRVLIDNVPDRIFIKDRQSRVVVVNRAQAVEVFGAASPEEVIGKSDFDFFAPELAEFYYAAEQKLLETGESILAEEYPSQAPDGRRTWHLNTKVPLRDAQGAITGLIGIVRDITPLKERELEREGLLRAEREQRALAETLAELSLALTAQMGSAHLLETILSYARRLAPDNDATAIFLLEDSDTLRLERWEASPGVDVSRPAPGMRFSLEQLPITLAAIRTAEPVVVRDAQADEYPDILTRYIARIRSYIALPIALRERVFGVIWIGSEAPGVFTREDIHHLQPLANAAAIAFENNRLLEETQARAAREERLNEIGIRLQESGDINDLLNTALHELGRALGARVGRVRLTIPEDQPPASENGGGNGASGQ